MFQTMNCVNRHCWLCLGVVYLMLQVLFPNWQTRLPHVSCIDSWLFIGNIYFSLSLSLLPCDALVVVSMFVTLSV